MNDSRFTRRRWWQFLIVRWLAVIGTLIVGLVTLIAIAVGLGLATANTARNAPLPASAWSGIAIVACFVIAILGLIVASAWILRRTAAAFGMVCEHCGATFDRVSYEYAMETGNCPSCVRRQNFIQTVSVPLTEDTSPPEPRTNPYAPPQAMEPQPPAANVLPPQSSQRTPLIGHVIRLLFMTWLGWISVVAVTVLVAVAAIRMLLSTRLDSQTPPWFLQAVKAQRNRDLACILGGAALAMALLLVGVATMTVRVNVGPTDLMHLHNIAGAATAIGLSCGELAYWRMRRRERVILPFGTWGCSLALWSATGWDKALRTVRFRTQDARGLCMSISDSVTGEVLSSAYVPVGNPNDWNEFELPLDDLIARGYSLKRIQIWLRPLDGRPWLLQYDETARKPVRQEQ